MYYKLPVKQRLEYMNSFRKANPRMSYHDMVKDYNETFEKFGDGGKVEVNTGGEKHLVYKKESPTGNGKGIEGHIMVTHPTKDKGKWDTIDLTAITNYKVKTVQDGVESTKKWHAENPEYAYGGIQRFDNGGNSNLPKRDINLNIRNKETTPSFSGWNENVNWQGEKYNDIGLDFNRNNLTVGVGNYIPRNTFEKVGNINPYLNLNYDLNDRTSIGANISGDYNGVSLVRRFDNGGRTPIVTFDKNDPRLKSYNDSLALYNLSQKAKRIFDVDPMDPTLESYNKKADALASKSKIKPTRLQLIGYSEPYKKDFDPYGMQEAWMVTYKKPVQPVVYKKETNAPQRNSSDYLEMRKSFLPSNRNVDIIQPKESYKKETPKENINYSKRQWDFNSPSGKIMRYYDGAGKELWNETYDHYTGKLISTTKK